MNLIRDLNIVNSLLLRLLIVLFIKSFFMIGLIIYGGIGLGPDEAQYWTWSRELAWGYYSKPPGIAWQIWVGTQLFGNTELGVRFLSIILGFCLSLTVYFLALACKLKPHTAFWAGIVMAFSPLGILASFFAITDVGLALFWTLSSLAFVNILIDRKATQYYLLGSMILFGALFKWPIYLFWVFVLILMPFYPWIRNLHFIGGFFLSLVGLLPSVIWNWTHQWVTFRHVSSTIAGGHAEEKGTVALFHGNFFEFLAAQASLLSPILFIILLLAFIALFKNLHRVSSGLIFCGVSSFVLLAAYSTLAFFQKMQGNWCSFAYPASSVLVCWYACEVLDRGKAWLKAGIGLSVILCAIAFSIPYIQRHDIWANHPIPYKMNPFRHNLGWENLASILKEAGYRSEEDFLFGDKYQMTSILSFYGPNQKRAYFFNLLGIRKNQFSFWPSMAQEQKGKTGFFVLAENMPHLQVKSNERIAFYQEALMRYFKEVYFLEVRPLFNSYGTMGKGALIFKCIDYLGEEPLNPELY